MSFATLAGLSAQERHILQHFTSACVSTIRNEDIISLLRCIPKSANQILLRLQAKGWLYRLKRGMYYIVPISSKTSTPALENPLTLVMDLFENGFISGWSAAEHWDFTEQIFNTISLVSTDKVRKNHQQIGDISLRIKSVTENRYFGFKTIWIENKKIRIADPHRTIIDILDMPKFGGGGQLMVDIFNAYVSSEYCDFSKLLQYAIQYKKGAVIKRLGYLTEQSKAVVPDDFFKVCKENISKGILCIDPDGPARGIVNHEWQLKINIPAGKDDT